MEIQWKSNGNRAEMGSRGDPLDPLPCGRAELRADELGLDHRERRGLPGALRSYGLPDQRERPRVDLRQPTLLRAPRKAKRTLLLCLRYVVGFDQEQKQVPRRHLGPV